MSYRPILCRLLASLALALAGLLPLASAPAEGGRARPMEKVVLQLKWFHQFQFAGYYLAKARGLYAARGLDVEIREASPSTNFTDEVVSGRADFGINNSDLIVERAHGAPVVVLGVIFQHSPLILLKMGEGGSPGLAGLIGKRVMVSQDAEAETYSMFENEGIVRSSVSFLPHSWNLEDLVSGKVDAVSAYSTNEALALQARGLAHQVIRPLTYGIDFYGDCLFTSEAELRSYPRRVEDFLAASLAGWDYAMAHPEEAADLIRSTYSTQKSREGLLAEAAAMDDLILPKLVPLGFMNPGRWLHIRDTYAKLGYLPADFPLEGFLYRAEKPGIPVAVFRAILLGAGTLLLLGGAYIIGLRRFNSRLAAEVASRTASLESLNRELTRSLAEKDVLLREVHHRVKNNLQVIASIANIERNLTESPEVAGKMVDIQNRIIAMATAHERLYDSEDFSGIDMGTYLTGLGEGLVASLVQPGTRVSYSCRVEGHDFSLETAIPLGLIVCELLTDRLTDDCAGRSAGMMAVDLVATGPAGEGGRPYRLSFVDDGTGIPESARCIEVSRRVGLDLVEALVRQLGGSISWTREPGLSATVDFRVPEGNR